MNFFILVLIFLSIINNFDSFHFKTKIRKNKKTLKASLEGIELGLITMGTGLLMDNTISKNSLQVLKNNSTILYNEGMRKVYTNLIFIGPIYYIFVEKFLINDFNSNPDFFQTLGIIMTHSLGYYFGHKNMHRTDFFKKYHHFHHQFNETLVPSIGNAVSTSEFTFAYMFPFVIGTLLVHPNINSLNLGIMIVSIMNLVIHCQELENIKWNKYFVSPQTHLYHHQSKNKLSTYSAPTFNLEYIFRNQTKI
tara:strand:+ start:1032 stop:1781 length:750 start_codon:yes stop_codon:yes gene_type:complete